MWPRSWKGSATVPPRRWMTPISSFSTHALCGKARKTRESARPATSSRGKAARANRTLALMGCMVGVKPSPQLQDRFPHVDVFMPPSEPGPLITFLQQDEIAAESTLIEKEHLAHRHALQDGVQPLCLRSVNQAPQHERRGRRNCPRARRLRLQSRLYILHHSIPPRH